MGFSVSLLFNNNFSLFLIIDQVGPTVRVGPYVDRLVTSEPDTQCNTGTLRNVVSGTSVERFWNALRPGIPSMLRQWFFLSEHT